MSTAKINVKVHFDKDVRGLEKALEKVLTGACNFKSVRNPITLIEGVTRQVGNLKISKTLPPVYFEEDNAELVGTYKTYKKSTLPIKISHFEQLLAKDPKGPFSKTLRDGVEELKEYLFSIDTMVSATPYENVENVLEFSFKEVAGYEETVQEGVNLLIDRYMQSIGSLNVSRIEISSTVVKQMAELAAK